MSSDETVAKIVRSVRSGDYGCAKCGDLCDCPNADKIIASIADRIEAAYKREVEELATAIRRLAEDACGHCDARYCESDCEQEHMPCRVVRESLQVADTYCPKTTPPPESDDGMPF